MQLLLGGSAASEITSGIRRTSTLCSWQSHMLECSHFFLGFANLGTNKLMFPQLMSTHLTQAGEVLQQEAMDFGG
jgi:hypothetical protein